MIYIDLDIVAFDFFMQIFFFPMEGKGSPHTHMLAPRYTYLMGVVVVHLSHHICHTSWVLFHCIL